MAADRRGEEDPRKVERRMQKMRKEIRYVGPTSGAAARKLIWSPDRNHLPKGKYYMECIKKRRRADHPISMKENIQSQTSSIKKVVSKIQQKRPDQYPMKQAVRNMSSWKVPLVC